MDVEKFTNGQKLNLIPLAKKPKSETLCPRKLPNKYGQTMTNCCFYFSLHLLGSKSNLKTKRMCYMFSLN